MNTPHLLLVSDGASSTGFSRVVNEIFSRVGENWQIHQLLLNHRRRPLTGPPWSCDACDLPGDPSGFERLRRLVGERKPDLVFILYDPRVAGLQVEEVRRSGHATRVVVYCPVEGDFAYPPAVRRLALADCVIPFTHYGAGELRRAQEAMNAGLDSEMRGDEMPTEMPVGEVIPHGVETRNFYPLPGGRQAARRALFPDRPDLEDKLWVLNANRNQPRKRIDQTMAAFSRFAATRDDVVLCLHMGRRDYGVDLVEVARELGIADRLLLTQDGDGPPDFSEERLNLVYNACDVGVNTSMGEGWGLISFEHAATGAAQVIPGHSVGPELWGDAALLVSAPYRQDDPNDYMERRAVDTGEVAEALGRLHDDRELLARLSRAAQQRATRPELTWDQVATRFQVVLESCLS